MVWHRVAWCGNVCLVQGAFVLGAVLEAFFLVVAWFVDYTKTMGSGSYSHNKKTSQVPSNLNLWAEANMPTCERTTCRRACVHSCEVRCIHGAIAFLSAMAPPQKKHFPAECRPLCLSNVLLALVCFQTLR